MSDNTASTSFIQPLGGIDPRWRKVELPAARRIVRVFRKRHVLNAERRQHNTNVEPLPTVLVVDPEAKTERAYMAATFEQGTLHEYIDPVNKRPVVGILTEGPMTVYESHLTDWAYQPHETSDFSC